MPRPSKRIEMSSIFPRAWRRALARMLRGRLPVRLWDECVLFWVQTKLIFSRAIVLILLALLAAFTYITVFQLRWEQDDLYDVLVAQAVALAVLVHMQLWETERDGRTYEMLMMRIPSLHGLLWSKLHVSLAWAFFFLSLFTVAYGWFGSMPVHVVLVCMLFLFMTVLLVGLFTCVVSTFIRHGLTAGAVAVIVSFVAIAFTKETFRTGKLLRLQLVLNPFDKQFEAPHLTLTDYLSTLLWNRGLVVLLCVGLYLWLVRRLSFTEKWIE